MIKTGFTTDEKFRAAVNTAGANVKSSSVPKTLKDALSSFGKEVTYNIINENVLKTVNGNDVPGEVFTLSEMLMVNVSIRDEENGKDYSSSGTFFPGIISEEYLNKSYWALNEELAYDSKSYKLDENAGYFTMNFANREPVKVRAVYSGVNINDISINDLTMAYNLGLGIILDMSDQRFMEAMEYASTTGDSPNSIQFFACEGLFIINGKKSKECINQALNVRNVRLEEFIQISEDFLASV